MRKITDKQALKKIQDRISKSVAKQSNAYKKQLSILESWQAKANQGSYKLSPESLSAFQAIASDSQNLNKQLDKISQEFRDIASHVLLKGTVPKQKGANSAPQFYLLIF